MRCCTQEGQVTVHGFALDPWLGQSIDLCRGIARPHEQYANTCYREHIAVFDNALSDGSTSAAPGASRSSIQQHRETSARGKRADLC